MQYNKMNFVIWGTGIWGKRMYQCLNKLKKYTINAFIDSSEDLQGSFLYNLPVISYGDYKKHYKESIIIISIASKQARGAIKTLLINDNIYTYYFHIDCPSEMIFLRKDGIPLEEIVKESGLVQKRIAITGNNLWSLILYDYLAECNLPVSLLYDDFNELYKFLAAQGYQCFNFDKLPKEIDLILRTDGSSQNKNIEIEQRPFKDFSFLKRYKNDRISELCNKFKEVSRCFIVATGPSLKIEDLNTLAKNKEFCFSMNRTYLAFEKTIWRPDVYVVADGKCLEDNNEDLIDLDVSIKLFSDASDVFWEINVQKLQYKKNIYKYHFTGNYFENSFPNFSEDLTKGTYNGGSVMYDCLQFAIYMGFKEIILIGVDFEFKNTGSADDNHFIKGYSKSAKQAYFYEGLEWQKAAYQVAKKYADTHGIKIYNATRGGKLEVFPRVDFDSLFERKK